MFHSFRFLAGISFTSFSNVASPAHPSDVPSANRCASTQSDSASTRNTISPDGPHHQSASIADCALIPPTAGSSFPDPVVKISSQKCGKSKPETANSTPQQNQSGTNPGAP